MLMPATADPRIAIHIERLGDVIVLRDANNPDCDADKAPLHEPAYLRVPYTRYDTAQGSPRRLPIEDAPL